MITGENIDFLLLLFNSKLFNKILLQSANLTGGKGVDFMNKINCIKPNNEQIKKSLVLLENDTSDTEKNDFINNMYHLTQEEKDYLKRL